MTADPSATPEASADPTPESSAETEEEKETPQATEAPEESAESSALPNASPSTGTMMKAPMMAPAANATVPEEEAVAQIGDTYYATLPDAIASATDGDTIIVLKDLDVINPVEEVKDDPDRPYIFHPYIEFNKPNSTVTVDFQNHKLTYTPEEGRVKVDAGGGLTFFYNVYSDEFLVVDDGNLVLQNGYLYQTHKYSESIPYIKMMGDYNAVESQKPTKITFENMVINDFDLSGYAGTPGGNESQGSSYGLSNSFPDRVHFFAQNSIINNCTFDGLAAEIKNSYVHNCDYIDWGDNWNCKIDFIDSVVDYDINFPNPYPLNPWTVATFTNTLFSNSLNVDFKPWNRYSAFWNATLFDVTGTVSSFDNKSMGVNNHGYSFATEDSQKILTAQTIDDMAKGVDDDGETSADQYMFVPGDADITFEAPDDFPSEPVNVSLSYSSSGYSTIPVTYEMRNKVNVSDIPLPAWTITGYDEEKKELLKQETTFDQLKVTVAADESGIDDQYVYITTYSKSNDGTHISIHVKAVKVGTEYTFKFANDVSGMTQVPDAIKETFGNGKISEPDKQVTRTGYTFTAWYLDKDRKVPFEYFNHDMDKSVVEYLEGHSFVDKDNTIMLYAGWEPERFTINFDANLPKSEAANTKNMPGPETVLFNGQFKQSAISPSYKNQDKEFMGWYLDAACTKPFNYFDKEMNADTLAALTKAGAIDADDTITLYAGWKASEKKPSNSGSNSSSKTKAFAAASNGVYFPLTSTRKLSPKTGVSESNCH